MAVVSACLLSCSAPGPDSGTTTTKRPNVLFVVWDTVRADRLGCYGYERPTTPHLDAFAEDALLYERAISPGMWTLPTHASLFTGLPVSAHGTVSHHQWLDNRFRTLAEIFSDSGYDTYAFSSNPHMSAGANLVQGFDLVEHPWEDPWAEIIAARIEKKLIPEDRSTERSPGRAKMSEARKGFYKECGPSIVEALKNWLGGREDDDRPFFAYLNYMEAHIPRIPSVEARRKVMSPEMLQRSLEVDQTHIRLLSYMLGQEEIPDDELEVISRVYDASLIDLDSATGLLFDWLESSGLADDTVIVLTSDHGENVGDHGLTGHKFCLYDTLIRVPLIVRYPPRIKPGRVAQTVSNLDLHATLLDLADLPAPPEGILSRSLLDLENRPEGDAPVFSEMVAATPSALRKVSKNHPDLNWEPWLRSLKSVEQAGYKFLLSSDERNELYRVEIDPAELDDLSLDETQRAESMANSIETWLNTFEPYDPSLAGPDDEPGELPPAVLNQLRALGYVD